MTDKNVNINISSATQDVELNIDVKSDTVDVEAKFERIEQSVGKTKDKINELNQSTGELFKTLESSSDKAVKAILTGTENWHQAMLNVIGNLEIKFAQMALNGVLEFAASQARKLVIAETTNSAIADNEKATSEAGAASHAMQILKQIKSDAAATYAGVYAFMSPVLGPAAAIPAGISAGAVAAMEGLVSLDVGAWNLGSDTVAQLHQGEMVVPKTFAEGLRDGGGIGGGGGDNYTININAIDTQTGAQFIKNNASGIAAAISSQVRNFNGNVPAWKG